MYFATYTKDVLRNSSHTEAFRNKLDARFDFWDETAPQGREVVMNRIAYLLRENEGSIPPEYLSNEIRQYPRTHSVKAGRHMIKKLSFGVHVNAMVGDSTVPLEDMVDLEGIHEFILTGKRKQNQ